MSADRCAFHPSDNVKKNRDEKSIDTRIGRPTTTKKHHAKKNDPGNVHLAVYYFFGREKSHLIIFSYTN